MMLTIRLNKHNTTEMIELLIYSLLTISAPHLIEYIINAVVARIALVIRNLFIVPIKKRTK